MGQPNITPPPQGEPGDSALILSFPDANTLASLPPEVGLATMRQMIEVLFAKVDSLQQNQAVQLAGVHDRLDAVELEIPLIQEQSALRMHDLEARVDQGIEETAAALQTEVSGKFSTLAARMEAQSEELAVLRDSRKESDDRLSRAILDIERLCSNWGAAPPVVPTAEPSMQARPRIAEHIRKAALDLAPGEDNPLVADPNLKKVRNFTPLVPNGRAVLARNETVPAPQVKPKVATPNNAVPGFEAWKRQFLQDGEPLTPSLTSAANQDIVVCPRCYSDRTRQATHNRLDRLFQMAGFHPYRCKSCANRFYKRDSAGATTLKDQAPPSAPDAVEIP